MPTRRGGVQGERLRARDQELGALLADARTRRHRTVSACAALLETSRRRYKAIEEGETAVTAAELEALMRFLEIPPSQVWGHILPMESQNAVRVQARPGERVQLVVEVQG
jgi:transcriptional regulator with XRE-family HTH domain